MFGYKVVDSSGTKNEYFRALKLKTPEMVMSKEQDKLSKSRRWTKQLLCEYWVNWVKRRQIKAKKELI